MTNVVPYHVGPREKYSLEFVNPDPDVFKNHLANRTTSKGESFKSREVTIETDQGIQTLYAVYSDSVPESILEEQSERDVTRIIDEGFTEGQLQVLEVILDVFTGIAETVEEEAGRFAIYKDIDLEKIPDALAYPDWGSEPVTIVGGQLLSRFILAHPMPNANHRTAVGLLERYLRSHGDQLVIPETGERGTWYEWARPFIHASKRLLTVRRNAQVFRYAQEFGVDVIRRKNNVDVDLHDFDLETDEPFEHFGRQHEKRSIDFVATILEEADADANDFKTTTDPGWKAFVSALQGGQSGR